MFYMEEEKQVLIYDSDCKFCNQSVSFLQSRNSGSGIRFIAASSSESGQLLQDHKIPAATTVHTVILIDKNKVYTKSDAVIRALLKRGGIWRVSWIFMIIPAFVRNLAYDWVAKIRRRL
jgi:predicted DCC family thiol-disulfide oxidoreductase YuxK